MYSGELQSRLDAVRSHYRVTPWIRASLDESPLMRSWQRCHNAGLRPGDRVSFDPVSRSKMAEIEDRYGALIRLAQPVMQHVGHALEGTGCTLLLVSPQATVIDRMCHEAAVPAAMRAALRVGLDLGERRVGTNAPAIALIEGEPCLVGREAHYCANVKPYFCVAAPLFDPEGQCLGAVDISAYDNVPRIDLFRLVVGAVRAIENRLLQPRPERLLVRLSAWPDLLETSLAAIVEVDTEGAVTGVNQACLRLLCVDRVGILGRRFADLFGRDVGRAFAKGHERSGKMVELHAWNGLTLCARIGAGADVSSGTAALAAEALREAEQPAIELDGPRPRTEFQADRASGRDKLPVRLDDLEMLTIERTLRELGGNVAAAARRLGVSRNTLYRRLAVARHQTT